MFDMNEANQTLHIHKSKVKMKKAPDLGLNTLGASFGKAGAILDPPRNGS